MWTEKGQDFDFEVDTIFNAGGDAISRGAGADATTLRVEACCCDYVDEKYAMKPSSQRLFTDLASLVGETSEVAGLEVEDLIELLFCDPAREVGETFKAPTIDTSPVSLLIQAVDRNPMISPL